MTEGNALPDAARRLQREGLRLLPETASVPVDLAGLMPQSRRDLWEHIGHRQSLSGLDHDGGPPARCVIHTIGPIRHGRRAHEAATLASCRSGCCEVARRIFLNAARPIAIVAVDLLRAGFDHRRGWHLQRAFKRVTSESG